MEPLKTFVLNGDDFKEANEERDMDYSGDQWRGTCYIYWGRIKEDFCCNICWSHGMHGDIAAT